MKKTLQDQYLLIKEGKGHKGVFLADAKRQFPNIVRNAATFEEASSCLKTKNIISENVIGLTAVNSPFEPKKKESYELAFENFLAEAKKKKEEDEKAELKATSKQVEKDLEHNFDYKDDKNPDNLIFDQIMTGYYTEMKDPKNADKTMQELKDMVFKNLQKDPIFYTKEGQFGVKGLGYSVDHPGLGEPKEPKGKYKASGYGDLNEGIHDRDILSRPLSNPDYEPFERSSEELGNEADNRSKNMLLMKYSKQINDPTISDEDLRYILGGKGVKGFGGRPNAIDKIIKDRNEGTLNEESKLRTVIREMIDAELEEAYQLVNINPLKSDKERNERDPQQFLTTYIDPSIVDSLTKNQHLRILRNPTNPENVTLAIRATLAPISSKNLGKTTDNLDKLGIDIPTDFKSFLTDTNNLGGEKKLPTRIGEMTTYKVLNNATLNKNGSLVIKVSNPKYVKEGVIGVIDNDVAPSYPINVPISYNDDKSVAHYSDDYKYDRQEGLLDVEDYLKQIEGMSKGDAFNYLEKMGLGNDEILTILKNHRSLSLKESVEKELAVINKEAEHEIIASKLEKVQALIDKKQTQISRLDEDEDLKDLTDAKKVKEISKDIKSLEKAKAKLEKMMHKGKAKSPHKEVIDETDEIIDEVDAKPTEEYLAAREKARDEYNASKGSIEKTQLQYPKFAIKLKNDIIGNEDGMDF